MKFEESSVVWPNNKELYIKDIQVNGNLEGSEKKSPKVTNCRKISLENEFTEKKVNNEKDLTVEHLLDKLGGFSWFQIWATIIIISPEIPAAMIQLSPILTGRTNVTFGCFNSNGSLLYKTQGVDVDCHMKCNGELKGISPFISVVQEWLLICGSSWITDTFTSIQMFGSMAGSILSAHLADRFGRKKTFFLLCFIMGVFGSSSGLANDIYIYAIIRFIVGFAIGGCFVVYLNFLMEFLTPSYRTICGCVSLWSFGIMLLALFGYLVPEWRNLSYVTALPVFVIFLVYPLLPESPRWLLCQKRTKEAAASFALIAKFNGRPQLSDEEIQEVQTNILKDETKEEEKIGTLRILKSPNYRKQLLLFMFAWFSSAVVYYGISFNMKNITGDPYLNILYMGIADFPGCFSGILFNNRFGRRRTFLGGLALASIVLIALVVVEETTLMDKYPQLVTILCIICRFFNSASWAVMACFTAETFPTPVRVTCVGLCSLSANIGGILAPQLAFFGTIRRGLPYFAYCILTVFTGIGSLLLSDMSGKPLKDSLS